MKKRSQRIIDYITMMIRRYPSLYPNATRACEYLLAVVGNGFVWKDGTIQSKLIDDIYFKPISVEDAIAEYIADYKNTMIEFNQSNKRTLNTILKNIEQGTDAELNRQLDVIRNSERLAAEPLNYSSAYPMPNYGTLLINVPDDISDDYKWLIKEFYEAVAINYENRESIDKLKAKIDSWNLID